MNDEQASHAVIGAAIEVHRALGPGYPESVYEAALALELEARGIPFLRQHPFEVQFRGRRVGEGRVDILAAMCLVIELKAVDRLAPVHSAQVVGYLKALGLRLGLLLNFNAAVLKDGLIRVLV
jgi:GxxExxY protein